MKSKFEIELKLKELTENKIMEDIHEACISSYGKAWTEVLEIALRVYQTSNSQEYLKELLFTHLNCLTKRIQGEILQEEKDLSGGWVTGTIDSIRWILVD